MAGYWPLFCVFLDRDEVEGFKLAKKERSQYPAILMEHGLVNYGRKLRSRHGFWGNVACGHIEWSRALHLAHLVGLTWLVHLAFSRS